MAELHGSAEMENEKWKDRTVYGEVIRGLWQNCLKEAGIKTVQAEEKINTAAGKAGGFQAA